MTHFCLDQVRQPRMILSLQLHPCFRFQLCFHESFSVTFAAHTWKGKPLCWWTRLSDRRDGTLFICQAAKTVRRSSSKPPRSSLRLPSVKLKEIPQLVDDPGEIGWNWGHWSFSSSSIITKTSLKPRISYKLRIFWYLCFHFQFPGMMPKVSSRGPDGRLSNFGRTS